MSRHSTPRILAGLFAAAIFGTAAQPARADLVGYWPFNSGSVNDIRDLSNNHRDGLAFGGPGFSGDVPSQIGTGTSLDFDGSSNYVALNLMYLGNSALPQMTAAGWFNTSFTASTPGPNVQENNWAILDFDRSDYFDVYVRDTDGRIGFSTRSPTGGIHDMSGTTTGLNDGMWHHVAVVYDGTDKLIYVDGAPDGTATNPHGGDALGSTNPRWGIIGDGSEATSPNGSRNNLYYDGKLDDVALWDNVLTPTQIGDLASGAAGPADFGAAAPTPPIQLSLGPQTIDFESLTGLVEQTLVKDRVPGVTFDGAQIIYEGGPATGFASTAGDDTPQSGEPAGGVMISDISAPGGTSGPPGLITMNFNGAPVEDLSFYIVDIDGTNPYHIFTGWVYDAVEGGNLLGTVSVTSGDPGTGDGIATLIDFGSITGIRRLEFQVPLNTGTASGFAADNFSFNVVPEPASLGLACLALVGLLPLVLRRRARR